MKKLLYLCLAVAFIFTACKKEDDTPTAVTGCMVSTACNYNAAATVAGSCTYAAANADCSGNCLPGFESVNGACVPPTPAIPSIVGVWTPTSIVGESSYTYYQNGILIDSMDTSYTSTSDLPDTIEFTTNGDIKEDGEVTGTYTYSNNTLTANVDGEITTMTCTVTATTFTGTMSETDVYDDGQGGVETDSFTIFLTCSRNTSGLTNTAVNQRKGNSSWFNKSNLLKNIKR
jgi:hypothetical protein